MPSMLNESRNEQRVSHVKLAEKCLPNTVSPAARTTNLNTAASPADVDGLRVQFQSQLDAFLKEDSAKLHLVNYAPPSFAVYHKELVLQLKVNVVDLSILDNEKDRFQVVEFICPSHSIRSFVEDEIASQDLINQSVALVNGVQIRLHLELLE